MVAFPINAPAPLTIGPPRLSCTSIFLAVSLRMSAPPSLKSASSAVIFAAVNEGSWFVTTGLNKPRPRSRFSMNNPSPSCSINGREKSRPPSGGSPTKALALLIPIAVTSTSIPLIVEKLSPIRISAIPSSLLMIGVRLASIRLMRSFSFN